ncbi:MAG: hypothetical protein ABIP53_10160 [Candidatus Limnocylindrales bacterium]
MADVEKILKLVADGVLTAQEADEILSATSDRDPMPWPPAPPAAPAAPEPPVAPGTFQKGGGRHLRIEVSEGGKRVVNLRVPLNIAGWASSFLPGLSDEATDRIRGAVSSGERGPILDVSGEDGSRVLIVSE